MKAPTAPLDELDDERLEAVVHAFYARVRRDDMLGPLFNAAVDDWDEHLDRLSRFWSSVMLTSGRYKGNPMATHRRHAGAIEPAMFDRWLELWRDVTDELVPPPAAAALQAKADHIAESLKLGLFFRLPPRAAGESAPALS
jgi:hemoglobin